MEEQLAKLIYDYTKKEKIIDKEFIESFAEIVVDNYNSKKYLNSIVYDESSPDNTIMSYTNISRSITIYQQNLNNEISFIITYFLHSNNSFLIKNLLILKTLMHELIHVKQYKIYDEKKKEETNTIEDAVTFISWSIVSITDLEEFLMNILGKKNTVNKKLTELTQKRIDKSYLYAPLETMAEIDACKIMKKILHILRLNHQEVELFTYFNYEILNKVLEVYAKTNFPFQKFVNLGHLQKAWKQSIIYDSIKKGLTKECLNLPLEERCRYGFPITEEEKEELQRKIILSRKLLNL
ncbi:TPA: hypothetical protein IAB95_00970 [Candidatus Ventrenecus avicola]|mgnify:CR=1 FL=1|nr:hypothetical protein [Candidatus Ventrenecus avicola]